MIAPEQDRLTQLMDELASRADGTAPADRLERVHRHARRTTQLRVAAAATVAAVVVVGAGALLTRTGDVGQRQQPGAPSVPATSTAPAVPSQLPSVPHSPTQQASSPPTRSLVPPTSQYPAAGSCAYASGTVVTVTMNPDVPMPRCVSVHPWQELRVVNHSTLLGSPAVTITVSWAGYPVRTLHPGESTTFLDPAGSYLAVGVHRVGAAPLYGGQPAAEVWLH